MALITKIEIGKATIEERDGKVYLNGKDIDTGKIDRRDIFYSLLLGWFIGAASLPFIFLLGSCLAKLID